MAESTRALVPESSARPDPAVERLEPPPVPPITVFEDEPVTSDPGQAHRPSSRGGDEPIEVARVTTPEFDALVPRGLQIAGSWAWRVIVIAALLLALGWSLEYLSEVTIPLAIALLLTAMLSPVAKRLTKWGVPRVLSTAITVFGGLLFIAGALTLITTQIVAQGSALGSNVVSGYYALVNWLQNGPLHLNQSWFNLDDWGPRIQAFLTESQSTIAAYAQSVGASIGHFLAGLAITLFALFFFLFEGRTIFTFLLKFFPKRSRHQVDQAAASGWVALSAYVRATILVALSDAIGVFLFAFFLQIPLAPALAVLVFIGAFVPIVGALVSGFVAVAVALVALGWIKALIMLGGLILVMQIEGHILQPFLLGRAVKIHPLAVILAIAIGIILGGIIGALLAVPILAFAKSFVQELNEVPGDQPVVAPG